jgi:hypothetical protein
MAGLFPLMASFGIENRLGVFRLYEIEPKETFQQLLLKFGPEEWEVGSSSIGVKVSNSKSASFDRFNLGNTVDLLNNNAVYSCRALPEKQEHFVVPNLLIIP